MNHMDLYQFKEFGTSDEVFEKITFGSKYWMSITMFNGNPDLLGPFFVNEMGFDRTGRYVVPAGKANQHYFDQPGIGDAIFSNGEAAEHFVKLANEVFKTDEVWQNLHEVERATFFKMLKPL